MRITTLLAFLASGVLLNCTPNCNNNPNLSREKNPIDPTLYPKRHAFVSHLHELIDRSITYESSYKNIDFPCGDVPEDIGVCADVVVRAFLKIDICLQQGVYKYRKSKGLSTDTNIDHRRVRNLGSYFGSNGWEINVSKDIVNEDIYEPGDIIWWKIGGADHIGIVYTNGRVLHNMGWGQGVDIKPSVYPIHKVYRIQG